MLHVKIRSIIADNKMIVKGLTQWDRGQTLEITGLDLPPTIEFHYSQNSDKDALTVIGTTANGVTTAEIPDELLCCDSEIQTHIYISDAKSGETIFTMYLPVEPRARPSGYITDPNGSNPFGQVVEQVSEYAQMASQAAADSQKILDDMKSIYDAANETFAKKDDVGNKNDLRTTDKSNIVGAINELADKIGNVKMATKIDIDNIF